MQSPLKRIIVFDLETGGLNHLFNPITEMAGVVLDTETLEIIEEFSVMFLPRLDLDLIEEESIKEAKLLFKDLATPDPESNIKTLKYKGRRVTLKSLEEFANDLAEFNLFIKSRVKKLGKSGSTFTYEEYLTLSETEYGDVAKVYFDHSYNPQALEVTHMSIDLLLKEGIPYEEAFQKIEALIKRHTIGTNKPILSGHNIKGFDIPFMVKLFQDNKSDFMKLINTFILDTLEMARLRWYELPSFSLGVCASALGLTLKEAHRALPDTIANAKFLVLLLRSMRGEGSQESVYVRKKFSFNF